MKKIPQIICIIIGIFFLFTQAFSAGIEQDISSEELDTKIKQCLDKQDSHREIEDFTCIVGSAEEIGYQIILDYRFNIVDEKIKNYIETLESDKGKYFGKDKQENYIDGIQEIIHKFDKTGEFGAEYYGICGAMQSKLLEVFPNGITIAEAINYFPKTPTSTTVCTRLADFKLSIYKQVSFNIMMLNKLQVSKDEKKLLVQQQRSKYDVLLSKFFVNIGYVQRIWAKWPSKTRITSGGG